MAAAAGVSVAHPAAVTACRVTLLRIAIVAAVLLGWEALAASGLLFRDVVPSLAAIARALARKLLPTRIRTRSICRMPDAALIAIGKKQETAPIAIFDPEPTPNHMIITGKKMIFGVGPR